VTKARQASWLDRRKAIAESAIEPSTYLLWPVTYSEPDVSSPNAAFIPTYHLSASFCAAGTASCLNPRTPS